MEAAIALGPERFALLILFASLRTGAALALLPALGGTLIPLRVRIGLAGSIGLLVIHDVSDLMPPADLLAVAGIAAIAGELLVGAVAALALHTAFAAASICGEWLAQSMGLGFATMVQPGSGPLPVLASLFALLLWAVFLMSGGHLLLIELIVESYRVLPVAGPLLQPETLLRIARWGGFALTTGLIAALPLAATLLLVNLVLAVAARSAPQLNLFSIGFPLMLMAGLVGLPLALPGAADVLGQGLQDMQLEARVVILG